MIVVPLSFSGFICSRAFVAVDTAQADVSDIPGPIPKRKWYLKFWSLIFICGFFPFGTVAVEMCLFYLFKVFSIKFFLVYAGDAGF